MTSSFIRSLADSLLYKDANTDTFWLVLIFFIGNTIWVTKTFGESIQAEKQSKSSASTTATDVKAQDQDESLVVVEKAHPTEEDTTTATKPDGAAAAPFSTSTPWHSRTITSRSRQVLAILFSLGVIPLQLLSGWWVLRIAGLSSGEAVRDLGPLTKPYLFALLKRAPLYGLVAFTCVGVVAVWAFAVLMQVGFVLQVAEMDVSSGKGVTGGEREEGKKTQ